MKTTVVFRLFLCYLIWGGVTDSFAQKFKPKYLRENDKSFLQLTSRTTDDGWIEFRADGDAVEAASFSTRFAKNLGLKEGYHLRLIKDETDPKETRHQHYQLYWKNVLVEGGHLSLHSRKGRLKEAHTRVIEDLAIDTDKHVDERIALNAALTDQKLTVADLKDKLPKGELVLTSMDGDHVKEGYRFAYYFDVYGKGGAKSKELPEANRVYIDAASGQVLKRVSLVDNCFEHDHITKSGKSFHLPDSKPPVEKAIVVAPMQVATFNSLYPRGNPTPSFEVEGTGRAKLFQDGSNT